MNALRIAIASLVLPVALAAQQSATPQANPMTTAFKAARQKDKHTFWCPNGHPRHFTSESVEKRLRANVETLQTRVAYRDAEISQLRNSRAGVERRLRATRGVVTRMRRRAKGG